MWAMGAAGLPSGEAHLGLDIARFSITEKRHIKWINAWGVLFGSSRLSFLTVKKKWPNIALMSAWLKRERERECSDNVVISRNDER
jgi:hypothetical protein